MRDNDNDDNTTNNTTTTTTNNINNNDDDNTTTRWNKQDELRIQTESGRRIEWETADQKHRTKERYLRPLEAHALRTHTEHRTTFLSAVATFRDRTRIARFLWQRLLDKTNVCYFTLLFNFSTESNTFCILITRC